MDKPPKSNPDQKKEEDDFLALSLSSINYEDNPNVEDNHNIDNCNIEDNRNVKPRITPLLEQEQHQLPSVSILPVSQPIHFSQTLSQPLLPFEFDLNPISMFVPPTSMPTPTSTISQEITHVAIPSTSSDGVMTGLPSSLSSPSRHTRHKSSSPEPNAGKIKTISPPFPWATDRKAVIHSYEYLKSKNIQTIFGIVQCKKCDKKYEMEFNLKEKFGQVWRFIQKGKSTMHDRAPKEWMEPALPRCKECGEDDSVKPIIEDKRKSSINWLFLWLGQLLGLCTLDQLKYFCKHTTHHRTAAKDRLLYLIYIKISEQLTSTNSNATS